GYLLGQGREDQIGPHVWSYVAGHAVREPELIRDLYAVAADRWVADGLTRHFVYVPAIRELVEPWLRLSFGISAALAARDTARTGPAVATDVTIRMGTPEDTLVAATYDRQLHLHLERSPSFSGLTAPDDQTYLDEWRNLPNEEEFTHF